MHRSWKKIQEQLQKSILPTESILSGIKLPNPNSKFSVEFQDSKHLPFYYYLGGELKVDSVLQIGPQVGLCAAAFLRANQTVSRWDFLGEIETPKSFVLANTKLYRDVDVHFIEEVIEKYDVCIVSRITNNFIRYWDFLKENGLLILDYADDPSMQQLILDFSEVKNRAVISFKTRYGVVLFER